MNKKCKEMVQDDKHTPVLSETDKRLIHAFAKWRLRRGLVLDQESVEDVAYAIGNYLCSMAEDRNAVIAEMRERIETEQADDA